MFWVISAYFNIRNTLLKSGTFLLGHPVYTHTHTHTYTWCVYIYIYIYIYRERERERERETFKQKPDLLKRLNNKTTGKVSDIYARGTMSLSENIAE